MKKPKSVDDYILSAPKEVQHKLNDLRKLIKATAPEVQEKISYGMPNYGSYKKGWISFAYFKNHIGVFITPSVLDDFENEIQDLRTGRATLRFNLDKKIPLGLIKKLVKASMKRYN